MSYCRFHRGMTWRWSCDAKGLCKGKLTSPREVGSRPGGLDRIPRLCTQWARR